MDSWRDHLKFGLVFEIPFILIMYFWKQWFQTTYSITDIGLYIFLFQLLVLIVISPLMPDIDHKLGKLREGLTFIGLNRFNRPYRLLIWLRPYGHNGNGISHKLPSLSSLLHHRPP